MQSPQYEYTYTGQQAADSKSGRCFLFFHQVQPQKETACGAQKQYAYTNGTGVGKQGGVQLNGGNSAVDDFPDRFLGEHQIAGDCQDGESQSAGDIAVASEKQPEFFGHADLISGRKGQEIQMENMPQAPGGEYSVSKSDNMQHQVKGLSFFDGYFA